MKTGYTFHHIGILTPSLDEAIRLYVSTFHYELKSSILDIPASGISACFLEREGSPRIELIEPSDSDSTLGKRSRSGTGGYHLGWSVPSLKIAQADLEAKGFHGMKAFESSLWDGVRCAFMVGPNQELVEFIEQVRNESLII